MSEAITRITRDNVEHMLDYGEIEMKVRYTPVAAWWPIRRNGKTWHGVRHKYRISIPVKAGLTVFYKINESDFGDDGTLDPKRFRIKAS